MSCSVFELSQIRQIYRITPKNNGLQTRILFLSVDALGWSTYGRTLEHYTSLREDIDAIHVRLKPAIWLRAAARIFGWHPMRYWCWVLEHTLSRVLNRNRFDVAYVSPQTAALALAQRRNFPGSLPFAVSLDITHRQYEREFARRNPPRASGDDARVLEAADLIVPWSHWAAESIPRYYGMCPQNVLVVPPCVPTPEELGFNRAKRELNPLPRIAFVGNDWVRKGGPRLLKWHQTHWSKLAELHVFSSKAKNDDRVRNVVWHGEVPNRSLVCEFLPLMDILVLPTSQDMLGIVLIEAAVAGLPVVCSRVGATSEIVCDGVTGFVVDPENDDGFIRATESLILDTELRSEFSRAAMEHAASNLNGTSNYNRLFDHLINLKRDSQ